MSVWHICGISLLTAVCAMIVKETSPRSFPFIGIFGGAALLFYVLLRYAEPISYINGLAERTGISEYISLVLKALAIGYGVGLTADLCRDMGETRIASGLELLGRAEIILIALPSLAEIIELAMDLAG